MAEHKKTQKSKFCVECGKTMKQNDKGDWFCPECGYKLENKTVNKEVEESKKEKSNTVGICCLGAIIFFVVIMIIGSLHDGGDTYSSSSSSYKSSSSGKYCVFIKLTGNPGYELLDAARRANQEACPTGETCMEAGDCKVTIDAPDATLWDCDGTCR